MAEEQKKWKALLLVGPSGSGKSTVEAALTGGRVPEGVNAPGEEITSRYRKVVSHTTRPRRSGEVDGVDYHFVTKEEMNSIDMVEFVEFGGNFYGVSAEELERPGDDRLPVIVVEPHGAEQIIARYGRDQVVLVYFDVPRDIRVAGMKARGDSMEAIAARLAADDIEERFTQSGICPDLRVKRLNPSLAGHIHTWLELYRGLQ